MQLGFPLESQAPAERLGAITNAVRRLIDARPSLRIAARCEGPVCIRCSRRHFPERFRLEHEALRDLLALVGLAP